MLHAVSLVRLILRGCQDRCATNSTSADCTAPAPHSLPRSRASSVPPAFRAAIPPRGVVAQHPHVLVAEFQHIGLHGQHKRISRARLRAVLRLPPRTGAGRRVMPPWGSTVKVLQQLRAAELLDVRPAQQPGRSSPLVKFVCGWLAAGIDENSALIRSPPAFLRVGRAGVAQPVGEQPAHFLQQGFALRQRAGTGAARSAPRWPPQAAGPSRPDRPGGPRTAPRAARRGRSAAPALDFPHRVRVGVGQAQHAQAVGRQLVLVIEAEGGAAASSGQAARRLALFHGCSRSTSSRQAG